MTIQSNIFSGQDTYGVSTEVAIRKDGTQFMRYYGFNGYGMGWTKWEMTEERRPVFVDGDNECMKVGWNVFTGFTNKRIRLPK